MKANYIELKVLSVSLTFMFLEHTVALEIIVGDGINMYRNITSINVHEKSNFIKLIRKNNIQFDTKSCSLMLLGKLISDFQSKEKLLVPESVLRYSYRN